MSVYVDSSVVLRVVLGQAGQLSDWTRIEKPIASVILHVECFRVVDRVRFDPSRDAAVLSRYRQSLPDALEHVQLILIDEPIIVRASQPLPFSIGTLDAIHLATTMEWRDRNRLPLTFATHTFASAPLPVASASTSSAPNAPLTTRTSAR